MSRNIGIDGTSVDVRLANLQRRLDDLNARLRTVATSGGVTNHGLLTGLSADDHPQYHNDARGDARYVKADLSNVPAGLATQAELDAVAAAKSNVGHGHAIVDTTGLQSALDAKAPLASPTFTGAPSLPTAATAVTQPEGTNTTQLATMAALQTATGSASSNRPSARVFNNANISVANATWQTLTFNSEEHDNDDAHSVSTNTSRIYATSTGMYTITAGARFAVNATGQRGLRVLKNGTTIVGNDQQQAQSGGDTVLTMATQVALVAGDYVEVQAFQASGAALNILYTAGEGPHFAIAWTGGTGAAWGQAGARVTGATTTADTGVAKTLLFNAEDFDVDGMHSTSTNTDRLTCTIPGLYVVNAEAQFQSTSVAGYRGMVIKKTSGGTTTTIAQEFTDSGENADLWAWLNVTTIVQLAAGDYLTVEVVHTYGATINIASPKFSAVRVGYQTNPSKPKRVRVVRSDAAVAQPCASGGYTTISFDTEQYDTDSMADLVAASGRITIQTAGEYAIAGEAQIQSAAGGVRYLRIARYNSAGALQATYGFTGAVGSTGINQPLSLASTAACNAGDYLQLQIYQNSGVSLNVDNYADVWAAAMSAARIGDL